MRVMFKDGPDTYYGNIKFSEGILFFSPDKAQKTSFRLRLRDAKLLSFGSSDDDFSISFTGYECTDSNDNAPDKTKLYRHRIVTFYPDILGMRLLILPPHAH